LETKRETKGVDKRVLKVKSSEAGKKGQGGEKVTEKRGQNDPPPNGKQSYGGGGTEKGKKEKLKNQKKKAEKKRVHQGWGVVENR